MRNLLAMLGAAVVTVAGVEVNTPKIGEDLHKGGEKLHGVIDRKFSKKNSEPLTPPVPPAPPPMEQTVVESAPMIPPVIYTGGEKSEKTPEPSVSGPELTPPTYKPPQK